MVVKFGAKRTEEAKDVPLTTPTGAEIVVSASRAATLLKRAPIQLPDGPRGYTKGHKEAEAEEPKKSTPGREDRK